MIDSLLIANRGEIACRIIRTARSLGVRTIAVYSDADAGARHVRLADAAVRIGPPPPSQSYLNIAALIDAARTTGAAAIHPGYGFLSENATFAAAVAQAGLVFVGPPADVIASMGSKSAAKAAMRAAGVPVLPGYDGDDQALDALERAGRELGYPLIVKPSGGGGGKGMQIVTDDSGLRAALESARRIAERSFANPALLLERYLPRPRHVEVQILADNYGSVLHLHDRDCSVQRRHQKLIEEAPAPGIPEPARRRLHEAAVTVARSIGYVNAGTVEFLYDDGAFFFMEMNTRLQVEHPVTEAITGLDLVEWQLRIASGEPLRFMQDEVHVQGAAVEARVCAEDPSVEFTPSSGQFLRLDWPPARDGLRTDAGFETVDRVPEDYDSLLGKVVCFAPTRRAAVVGLADGLDQIRAVGVVTNAHWLALALRTRTFLAADVSTRFLDDEAHALAAPGPGSEAHGLASAITALVIAQPSAVAGTPWQVHDAFRIGPRATVAVRGLLAGQPLEAHVDLGEAESPALVGLGSSRTELRWQGGQGGQALVTVGGVSHRVEFERHGNDATVWIDGAAWPFSAASDEVRAGTAAEHDPLMARLPGTVTRVLVGAGDRVEKGQTLLVLEAMKMEHTIRAAHAGTVQRVNVGVGDRVREGQRLAEVAEANPVP